MAFGPREHPLAKEFQSGAGKKPYRLLQLSDEIDATVTARNIATIGEHPVIVLTILGAPSARPGGRTNTSEVLWNGKAWFDPFETPAAATIAARYLYWCYHDKCATPNDLDAAMFEAFVAGFPKFEVELHDTTSGRQNGVRVTLPGDDHVTWRAAIPSLTKDEAIRAALLAEYTYLVRCNFRDVADAFILKRVQPTVELVDHARENDGLVPLVELGPLPDAQVYQVAVAC